MPEGPELWQAVDGFIAGHLLAPDAALEAALGAGEAAGLPPIGVAPNQGKLLHLLVALAGARRVLEVGTLAGYSTIWMARALPPGGRLVSLEVDDGHARIARDNLAAAGLAETVEVRVGPALESLDAMIASGEAPFDLVFLDADKEHNADYVERSLLLTGPGRVIVVDNVVRGGAVLDGSSTDAAVRGTRRLFEYLAGEPRLSATAVQTVGAKGHDGFVLARVLG